MVSLSGLGFFTGLPSLDFWRRQLFRTHLAEGEIRQSLLVVKELLVASLLLVAMPGAPSSFYSKEAAIETIQFVELYCWQVFAQNGATSIFACRWPLPEQKA